MKAFLTGATGYIGQRLALRLAEDGHQVRALVRSPEKARLIQHPNISLVQGTLSDFAALVAGTAGCDVIFHMAAFARVWAPDPTVYTEINVEGTGRVLQAALQNQVKRVVVTSTAGVFGPSDGVPVQEAGERSVPFFNEYEETKRASEILCEDYAEKGLEVVVVNPSRVYGPGISSESNPITRMINLYVNGSWRWIPGDGNGIGNYVLVDDVVQGHLLAWEKGRPGERYLLGGENASYNAFFQKLQQVSGVKKRMVHVPVGVLLFMSNLMMAWTNITGKAPLITPKWVRKYLYHWELSSQKAADELGYSFTPLKEGISQTLEWLNRNERKTLLHPDHRGELGYRQGAGPEVRVP
jgi:NAD+-dependent farnesol dehydrogenase